MSVKFEQRIADAPLRDVAVFLGASIPDPNRWSGYFDAREITDAVVAVARALMTADAVLVSGAHPTISPLLLYVAAEFPVEANRPRVLIYQSALYEPIIPQATRRFEEQGVGILRMVDAAPGESLESGTREASLRHMREKMFTETSPRAGIFIGGMQGITAELQLLRSIMQNSCSYPVAKPGGEAATLVEFAPEPLRRLLAESSVYPTIGRRIVDDLASRLAQES